MERGSGVVLNRELVLVSWPQGWPCEGDFEVREHELSLTQPPAAGSRDVHVKCLWASVDPYQRVLLRDAAAVEGRLPTFQLHKPIWSLTLSKVIASDNPDFQEGDVVHGITNIADYAIVPGGAGLEKIKPAEGIPLTHYLGILGMPGHTAWVGLKEIAGLKSNEEVYITAAAGAVGLLAGQLAKLKGCRVVGSAGSDEKVKILKDVYNFDDAFNYKTEEDWDQALKRLLPRGIDVYFDNVGGKMLDAVLLNMSLRGRIVVCGTISQYNKKAEEVDGVCHMMHIVKKMVRIEGFVETFYLHTKKEFLEEVIDLIRQGKVKYKEDVLGCGVHEFPRAFIGMLKGQNIGKSLLQISKD